MMPFFFVPFDSPSKCSRWPECSRILLAVQLYSRLNAVQQAICYSVTMCRATVPAMLRAADRRVDSKTESAIFIPAAMQIAAETLCLKMQNKELHSQYAQERPPKTGPGRPVTEH